jgi:hypothetical protein
MHDKPQDSPHQDHPALDKLKDIAAQRAARLNILLMMVDQLYYPNRDADQGGFAQDIKNILSFVGSLEGNQFVPDKWNSRICSIIRLRQLICWSMTAYFRHPCPDYRETRVLSW